MALELNYPNKKWVIVVCVVDVVAAAVVVHRDDDEATRVKSMIAWESYSIRMCFYHLPSSGEINHQDENQEQQQQQQGENAENKKRRNNSDRRKPPRRTNDEGFNTEQQNDGYDCFHGEANNHWLSVIWYFRTATDDQQQQQQQQDDNKGSAGSGRKRVDRR
jgi:hypothetical protein